jgi:hypothetical protein
VYQKSFAMREDHGPRDALDAPGPNHFHSSVIGRASIIIGRALAFRGARAAHRSSDRAMMEAMMKRSLFCLGFLVILDSSGFSQAAKPEPAFYVVLNSLTKNFTVASDTIFRSRTEAEAAAKTLTPCKK